MKKLFFGIVWCFGFTLILLWRQPAEKKSEAPPLVHTNEHFVAGLEAGYQLRIAVEDGKITNQQMLLEAAHRIISSYNPP